MKMATGLFYCLQRPEIDNQGSLACENNQHVILSVSEGSAAADKADASRCSA